MPSSRGSSRPRDRTCISWGSCIADVFFTSEPPMSQFSSWLRDCWFTCFPSALRLVAMSPGVISQCLVPEVAAWLFAEWINHKWMNEEHVNSLLHLQSPEWMDKCSLWNICYLLSSLHRPFDLFFFAENKIDGDWGFPGSPMVKNPPCNAGDLGGILSCESKIPHAAGQQSPCTITTKLACPGTREPQLEKLALCNKDPVSRNCVPMQPNEKYIYIF